VPVDQGALLHQEGVEVIHVQLGPGDHFDQRALLGGDGAFASEVGHEILAPFQERTSRAGALVYRVQPGNHQALSDGGQTVPGVES
jgi:hypothetical protein